VDAYPTPLGATTSAVYTMTAGATPVFVEHYRDVSYARFAMCGATEVVVTAHEPMTNVRLIPQAAVASMTTNGNSVHLTLHDPANVVVFVNNLEKLFLLADPPEASRPDRAATAVVTAAAYGADATGKALSTAMLQKALDDTAARPGGGTLLLEAGTYLTGTLTLRSHVTLYLAPGAILHGSSNPADYPKDPGRHENGSDPTITPPDLRYLGQYMTFSRLVLVDGATDAHIRGRGTIDGNGSYLRKQLDAVPNIVRVRSSDNVTIEDVMLRDSAAWTLHLLKSHDLNVTNLKIINDRTNLNTDGIDPDSVQNLTIDRAFIYTKDDGVVLKATNNTDLLADVANVTVKNSVVSSVDAALKLGSESQSTQFHDILFENNDVFDCDRAMSVVVRDGAQYKNVTYRNIRVGTGVNHLIEQVIGLRDGQTVVLGSMENLIFDTIDAPSYAKPASNWTWYAQYRPDHPTQGSPNVPLFEGADATHAVSGLTLKNVKVRGTPLTDAATAASVANLTSGGFVSGLSFQ
jgi:polygalacturonase